MQRPSSPWPRTGTGRQSARRDALERTAALRLTSRRSPAQGDYPLSGRWQPAMAALKCLYVGAGDARTDIHRSYRLNRSTTQSRGGVCHEQAYVLLHRRIRNDRAGRAGLRRDQGAARQRVSSDPMTPPCYRRTTTARFNVNKDEKPVKHGGWIGLAAGAGAAILFPPLAVGVHRCRGGRRGAGRMVWALGARHVAQRHQRNGPPAAARPGGVDRHRDRRGLCEGRAGNGRVAHGTSLVVDEVAPFRSAGDLATGRLV